MAYIIGNYNKYDAWDRAHTVQTFYINDQIYGIKRVELCWGVPVLGYRVDRDDMGESYYVYSTLEEAQAFVQQLKHLNR